MAAAILRNFHRIMQYSGANVDYTQNALPLNSVTALFLPYLNLVLYYFHGLHMPSAIIVSSTLKNMFNPSEAGFYDAAKAESESAYFHLWYSTCIISHTIDIERDLQI